MYTRCVFYIKYQLCVLDCGELMVSNGNLNDTSTTCGTIRALTCEPCYDLVGNGVAICETDESWTFDSECVVKGMAC